MRTVSCALAAAAMFGPSAQANPAENDVAMVKLATSSGCMDCHTILPAPRRADGLPPIAPAWRDIAIKYRDDPLAYERLTRIVMTGSDPRARHWAGKVGADAMPPNATALTQDQARVLVDWILVLVP